MDFFPFFLCRLRPIEIKSLPLQLFDDASILDFDANIDKKFRYGENFTQKIFALPKTFNSSTKQI
jgi:hypothetical protein